MSEFNVLITGASGFIGSAMVDKALSEGYETWAAIRKSSNLKYLSDNRLKFVYPDFSNKNKLISQIKEFINTNGKIDYIIHVAGVTKVVKKHDFERINYENTKNFVEALIDLDAVPKAFVYMSSLGAIGPVDEDNYEPIYADSLPSPNTWYGKSKLKTERFLKSLDNFPYIILRPTGVFGPRDMDYYLLMKAVKRGINVNVGFKKQLLSFIYIKDLTEIVFRLLEKGITRQEYNVSDGKYYSGAEFNEIVREELNKKRVVNITFPLFLVKPIAWVNEKIANLSGKASTLNNDKYKIMKQRNWICDITPLIKDIGFEPKYSLRDGIIETIEWYKRDGLL